MRCLAPHLSPNLALACVLASLPCACAPEKLPADTSETGDTSDTAETGDTEDTADTITLPDDWPDSWGLLALNLHCLKLGGTSFESNDARLAAIAREVASRDIVALALQEACKREGEDALGILEAHLESESDATWSSLWGYAHLAWEGTDDEADEGLGLMVRGNLSAEVSGSFYAQAGLQRVYLGATMPGGIRLFTVHLDHQDEDARAAQARELATLALATSDPDLDVLVAGDFNDGSSSSAMWAMTGMGFLEDSAEQADPRDHVLRHRAASLAFDRSTYLFDGVEGPRVSDHEGIAAWYRVGAGQPGCATRIRIEAEIGAGRQVFLRGSDFPLDWYYGLPTWMGAGESLWVTTEIEEGQGFEFKALLDDTTWQAGPNEEGLGCEDHVIRPVWEG
jgi:endonuclease/exonuclease/phosphatase family metal-dependent hydrolase